MRAWDVCVQDPTWSFHVEWAGIRQGTVGLGSLEALVASAGKMQASQVDQGSGWSSEAVTLRTRVPQICELRCASPSPSGASLVFLWSCARTLDGAVQTGSVSQGRKCAEGSDQPEGGQSPWRWVQGFLPLPGFPRQC